MNWMDKLERKWGRHAVANLSRYFVLAQVIGYVVQLTAPGLMSYMNFDMGSILHGQIWRVVTWIFTPTASLDVFGILFLFCVLMWGSSLESMLGTFRMNVFLWGSVILCDIVGAIVYVVTRILLGYGFSPYLSTYYILMSMLLALAMWAFLHTKTGTAMTAVGSNPSFAKAAGVSIDKMRLISVVLSTWLGAVGILVYEQGFGFIQIYTAPLKMAFPAVAAILIGGASVNKASIANVIIGTFLYQGLVTMTPTVINSLIHLDISEIIRIIVSNGMIVYALTRKMGGKK